MTFGFETLAIHAGQEPEPRTGAVVPPIYQTSTYAQDAVGAPREGYEYSRTANPTRDALQDCLAALEGGRRGLAFASGLAAEDTLLRTVCRPGDHVVIPDDAYGGTFRLFAKVAERWGLQWTAARISDVDAVRAAVRKNTKIIWVETPTNPLLGIADLAGLAALAHDHGALLAVDNTFASPYLQQPLALGADVVIHSTTKYVGGHSDVVGGALVTADEGLGEELAFHQNAMGAVVRPVRRLADAARGEDARRPDGPALRQRRAHRRVTCRATAEVAQVLYPGLPEHPGHEVAAKQMRRFGGMISFRAAGGEAGRGRRSATGPGCSSWPSRSAGSSR